MTAYKKHVTINDPPMNALRCPHFIKIMQDMRKASVSRSRHLIDAAVKGAQILITKDDQNAVKLVPLQNAKPRPRFGSGKGLITLADDFNEPLKDFEEYS